MKESDEDMMKAALKKPKGSEVCDIRSFSTFRILTSSQPKAKKNITTDLIGDKVGRIHVGKQDLTQLQTRKMKGLKRSRGDVDADGDAAMGDAGDAGKKPKV